MRSILSKAKLGAQPGARPPVAVELSPRGVLASALPGPGQPAVFAFEPLPEGALIPGIGEPNLRAPEVVANAMRSALGQVAPRTRSVTLIVSDTVVRVFVLDFDSLPGKAAEAIPVLRFRLRKMIPFEVEHAGLGYQVLVENKAVQSLVQAHEAQLVNYLATTGIEIGLLLNFGASSLQVKRKYRTYRSKGQTTAREP